MEVWGNVKGGHSPVHKKRTIAGSLFVCPIVTNYRTFVDDFMKIIQFIEEYNYYITDIMN